jgi:hypothetical protein
MREFKLFHGYNEIQEVLPNNRQEAFERLMDMLHEMDAMVEPLRGYELPEDDISDWDVTLSDGLGEE